MNIWIVTMEYAGIIEAGGVKDVACSLAESLAGCKCSVTVFMPRFGCATTDKICNLKDVPSDDANINICKKNYQLSYKTGNIENIEFVFVEHEIFAEKNNVYTYTEEDENKNPLHKKGNGFEDARLVETLFLKGVAAYGVFRSKKTGIDFDKPDIILCHDAATACLPAYIRNIDFFKNTKCAVTIHNAGPAYHHEFSSEDEAASYTSLAKEFIAKAKNGERVEPFLLASESGAVLTTVSKEYARELEDISNNEATDGLSSLFVAKKIDITGITNGIDCECYNPADTKKSLLPFAYNIAEKDISGKYKCRKFFLENFAAKEIFQKSVNDFSEIAQADDSEKIDYVTGISRTGYISNENEHTVYFAYHGRVVTQKGIDLLVDAAKAVMKKNKDARFVIVGQGEERMEEEIAQLAEEFAGRVIFFKGYNKAMARLAVAVCDYIVLPSIFEPCGLEDFIAQILGTLPVAHATGGLKKIIDGGTGFLYEPNDTETLSEKILQLIKFKHNEHEKFIDMIFAASSHVHEKYNWKEIAEKKYLPFFEKILGET